VETASFTGLDTQVLGISVDSVPCLTAWAKDLGGINYPLLSDFWPHGKVAEAFGVLREDGKCERAIFVIDREGMIQYVDVHDIDDQPSNDVLRREIRRIDPLVRNRPEQPKPKAGPLPHGGIVMYCTSWCPDCKLARTWLTERGLKFTEVDINKLPGAAEQLERWTNGSRTTPTFDIDGEIVVDFDLEKLRQILGVV
jgi:glutaredoxin